MFTQRACRKACDPDAARKLLDAVARSAVSDTEQEVQTAQGRRVHRIRAQEGRDPATGSIVAVLNEYDITDLVDMRRRLNALHTDLERHVAERNQQLKISEERFSLAMRGANDGLWDLDIASGSVYLSPRWYAML